VRAQARDLGAVADAPRQLDRLQIGGERVVGADGGVEGAGAQLDRLQPFAAGSGERERATAPLAGARLREDPHPGRRPRLQQRAHRGGPHPFGLG
jgi:hypothetical protein